MAATGVSAKRRFWVTVAAFAVANAAVWVGVDHYQRGREPRKDILSVERFSPDDGDVVATGAAERTPQFSWHFNLDVGDQPAAAGKDAPLLPVTFSPAVRGDFRWTDPRTLTFRPAEPLPRATKFTATLNPAAVATPTGYTLSKPVISHFATPALSLERVRQAAVEEDGRVLLELSFNDQVNPADVLAHVQVHGPDGKKLPVELSGRAASDIVRLLAGPLDFSAPAGKQPGRDGEIALDVELSAGLAGASGPLAMEDVAERTVTIDRMLLAEDLQSSTPETDGDGVVLSLRFNNPLPARAADLLAPLVTIDPPVEHSLRVMSNLLSLSGNFAPGTRYTVKIAKPAEGDDARKYPRPATMSVFVPDYHPEATFAAHDGYLGSAGNRTVKATVVNLAAVSVQVYRVYENNLVGWHNNPGGNWRMREYAAPVAQRRIELANKKNTPEDLHLNLDELLGEKAADGAYEITLLNADAEFGQPYWRHVNKSTVITLSDVGLTGKVMADETNPAAQALTAWAVSLSTGTPLPNTKVRVYSNKNQLLGEATTDADGLARIKGMTPAQDERPALLIAQSQTAAGPGGLTWLDLDERRSDSRADTGGRPYMREGYEAYLYTERGVYRPGETVTLRGIVRGADLAPAPEKLPLKVQLHRPDGRPGESATVAVDADGAIEWRPAFAIDAPTGYWTAIVSVPGDKEREVGTVHFQVEEFLPDRVKTAVTPTGDGLVNGDGRLKLPAKMGLDIQSDYLFGQPAAELTSTVKLVVSPGRFNAPDGFVAGDTAKAGEVLANEKRPAALTIDLPALTLDKNGHAQAEADLGEKLAARLPAELAAGSDEGAYVFRGPWRVDVSESTAEVSGRAVTANKTVMADALPYYVCVRGPAAVGVNARATFAVRLLTPAATPLPDQRDLRARIYREHWESHMVDDRGHWRFESNRLLEPLKESETNVHAGPDGGAFAFTPHEAGSYVLELLDPATAQATTLGFWVGDANGWNDSLSRDNPESLEVALAPENPAPASGPPLFHPGEHTKALIRSPFPGRLLVTVESDHLLWSHVSDMTSTGAEVPIELPQNLPPNAFISAMVVRKVEPDKEWQTHRAFGIARFTVDPSAHRLNVKVAAIAEMRPGRTLDVDVAVSDNDGHASAETAVALMAVDEGILRLTNFVTPDPLKFFMSDRALGVETADLYDRLMPEVARVEGVARAGGDGDGALASTPVPAKRVKPVALVTEILHTGPDGIAHGHLQVPQFLGQLRVMAVACHGAAFGSGEAPTIVRSPLVIQSSFPRFLAPGDDCRLPMLVINNTAAPGDVKLDLTTDAAELLTLGDVPAVHLEAGEQKTVLVTLTASQRVGVGHVKLAGVLGNERFDEDTELPVRPPSPPITRGGVLITAVGKATTVDAGGDMMPGTGELELHVSPRPQLSLPDALSYLDHYPYGCVEQTTSTCLPLVYLPDIGREVAPDLFDPDRVARKVQAGIRRLISMQTSSGGLAMWPGGTEPWVYGTVYASQFVVEAGKAGFDVPDDFRTSLLGYVKGLLADSPERAEDVETQAYAAYVLALAGKPERAAMNRLAEIVNADKDRWTYGDARLYLALAQAASGRIEAAMELLPQELPLPRNVRSQANLLTSPVRDEALLLTTLLTINPDHPAIPAMAAKLAAGATLKTNDGWLSTHDNALAFLALGKYLRTTKGDTPFSAAAILVGGKEVAHAAAGQTAAWSTRQSPDVPVTVSIEGPAGARGYISWMQHGVPLAMPAGEDHVLKVRRTWLTEKDKAFDSAPIVSGTAVKVRLTIDTPRPLENVVIEDLLPAGLEIENPRLETSAKKDADAPSGPGALAPRRIDMRDDRLVLMTDVPAGTSTFTYLARAVTPGTYVVPPLHGECMYDPGINSLADGGGKLVVTPVEKKALAQR